MRGQVFILGAISLAVAIFVFLPTIQKEIYLPDADSPALENLATEYNYWIARLSVSDSYNPLAFGSFVKKEYPYVGFFYVLADKENVYVANFFDQPLNVSVNGRNFLIKSGSYETSIFQGNLTISSDYRNFTYGPENDFSGAIFLQIESPSAKLSEFRVFR